MDAFEQWVRGGAEVRGIELEDDEVHIMRVAHAVYGPPITALLQADLAGVWAEPDLDPSRAPRSEPGA